MDGPLTELRAALERGNWPLARLLARQAIEARPALVFEDLGFAAAFARHGRRLPGYGERVRAAFNRRWGRGLAQRAADHDCGAIVAADAPNEAWMCCDRWTRKFNRKPNMRAFAERNGVAVPQLYHVGTEVDAVPFDRIPPSAVFKVDPGHDGQRVLTVRDGADPATGRPIPTTEIVAFLRRHLAETAGQSPLILVEELVRDESPERMRPINYKFTVMGGRAVVILAMVRNENLLSPSHRLWIGRDFTAAPRSLVSKKQAGVLDVQPPPSFAAMTAQAEFLGTVIGEPCRIDMYASDRGPVLGEITVNPFGGYQYSEFGEFVLGQAWEIFAAGDIAPRPVFPDDVPAGELARELGRRAARRARRLLRPRGARGAAPP